MTHYNQTGRLEDNTIIINEWSDTDQTISDYYDELSNYRDIWGDCSIVLGEYDEDEDELQDVIDSLPEDVQLDIEGLCINSFNDLRDAVLEA